VADSSTPGLFFRKRKTDRFMSLSVFLIQYE